MSARSGPPGNPSTPPGASSSPPGASGSRRPGALRAASFCALGSDPASLSTALGDLRAGLPAPCGAVVFASGASADAGESTLFALRSQLGDIPMVLASSPGVLTERAEHEGVSAVSGLVWSGGTVTPMFVPPKTGNGEIGGMLARQVAAALGDASGTVILLAQPQGFTPHTLDELGRFAAHATVVGAGTLPGGAWVSSPERKPAQGEVVGLIVRGLARPAVRSSPACRLLAPLAPIKEARGPMVFRVGDEPALELLSRSTRELSGRPLVLAVLAPADSPSGARPGLLIRGIRGVDPGRKSVVVTDEASPGMLMTFAVCDPSAARADLAGATRELARDMAGAAPQFGLLMNCAGRGMGLYGERDVDTRIVRERFPNVPFAGMFSTFEIGPLGHRAAMHLYTSVVAMFGSPS